MESSRPTFREAFLFWLKLGFISFGGPAGQIAIMHREVVERRKWVSESRFLHALNYCMLLPGPEAQQLATYLGWLLNGTRGGIVAGALFVLPSAILLWVLSCVYVMYGNVPWLAGAFYGLKPAVLAIVVCAVLRIGGKVLKSGAMWFVAAAAFIAIFFGGVPFPFIVAGAAILGWLGGKWNREQFHVIRDHGESGQEDTLHAGVAPTMGRALRITTLCLALWWIPVFSVGHWLGWNGTHFRQGVFFSQAAMVTFGGAYAVLPYVAQEAVQTHGWLSGPQMLDGLGLAETTPGPLIMVLQFVGFLGGWNHPGELAPLASATLGAAMTTWTTFLPCFLWIFLGAPYIERLRGNAALSCALSAITAAVVGVVLNLAVWMGIHVLFPGTGTDWHAVGIALFSFVALQRFKWPVMAVIPAAAVLGMIFRTL